MGTTDIPRAQREAESLKAQLADFVSGRSACFLKFHRGCRGEVFTVAIYGGLLGVACFFGGRVVTTSVVMALITVAAPMAIIAALPGGAGRKIAVFVAGHRWLVDLTVTIGVAAAGLGGGITALFTALMIGAVTSVTVALVAVVVIKLKWWENSRLSAQRAEEV